MVSEEAENEAHWNAQAQWQQGDEKGGREDMMKQLMRIANDNVHDADDERGCEARSDGPSSTKRLLGSLPPCYLLFIPID